MAITSNYEKHTTKNPIGRWFLNNFINELISTVRPLQLESILDVGAGEGFTLARLSLEKIGKKLEGIEYLEEAIELGKTLHPKMVIKQGTIYQLPYRDNSFDLVISTEVLEHLDSPEKGLQELIRVSKKYVLVSVPNEPWFTIQRFIRGKNILKLGDHPEHLHHWTSKGFREFVERHANSKVRIVAKKYPFPWTMLLLDTLSSHERILTKGKTAISSILLRY
jgi:2-polyprenyl-3-methyl-5-hydroxy-6-metoxy-1,4-benzoquinol methylase